MTPTKSAGATVADRTSVQAKHGIIRLINRVRVELIDLLDQELSMFDITAAQLIVLASVANKEADSAATLCKSISYDPGAMTRMIDRLERKGFVRRVRSPEDRRVVNLALTEEGKAVYPKLVARAAAATNRRLRGFTKAEAQQLEGFLQRMLVND